MPWWTAELTKQRSRAKRARKAFQRCCPCRIKLVKMAAYRRENRIYKTMIKDEKIKSWQNFVAQSINEDPYSLAYKLGAGKLKTKEILTTFKKGQYETSTNKKTIQLLMDSLVPEDNNENENETHAEKRRDMQATTNANLESQFSMDELEDALNKSKNNRSAGIDQIPAEILKNMNTENKIQLLSMYNSCWSRGFFPRTWKKAKLKVIRKAGDRDWASPGSYRPISLLPTTGKVMERLIASRPNDYLNSNNILSEHQFGFRRNRSTIDAIERVKEIAVRTNCKYTIVILVDIKGAFDAL